MSHRFAATVAAVAFLFAAAVGATMSPPQAAPPAAGAPETHPAPPPEFTKLCVRCHPSEKIVEGRRYPSQWDAVIEQMVARGATGTDEEFDKVYDYLVTEFGRVEINKAPADEIAQVLHLEPDLADVIVKQRPIADFDTLAALPGMPVDDLKKRRDAIVF